MKIPTLTNYLFEINQHRDYYQDQMDKRKAFWYVVAIFTVIMIGVLGWILRP